MASFAGTSTLNQTLLRRRLGLRRWLLADPREVVEVEKPERAGGATATPIGLEAGLARQGARIQRSRLAVLLRRHLLVALAVAIVLEILALLDVLPQLVVAIVAVLVFVVGVGWALRRRLSPSGVAQLLDDRLLLFDRLGTALELERRGAGNGGGSPLERRTVAEATTLVEGGANGWRPRPTRSPREWGAVGVALALLAALVVLAVVPGSGPDESRAEANARKLHRGSSPSNPGSVNNKALEQYLGAKRGPANLKPSEITPGQIRPGARRQGEIPNGKRADESGETFVSPGGGEPANAQQGFQFSDEALNDKRNPQEGKGAQAGGQSAKAAGEGAKGGNSPGEANEGSSGAGGAQKGEGQSPAAGKTNESQGKSGNPSGSESNSAGTKPIPGAPASKAAAATKGNGAIGAPGTSTKGQSSAGNGVGGNRTGHSREIEGGETKGLKLQAGYAPYRGARGAENGGKSGERQGAGGKARTEAAEGGSEFGAGGGAFAFVPNTGGAVAGAGGSQLAQNYSAALKWLERLPW